MSPPAIAHYRISAKLGQGGKGEVTARLTPKLGREVAIKISARGIRSRRRAHAAVQARSASARGAESSEYGSGFRAWKRDLIVFPNWHGAAVLLPRTPRTEADASRKSKKPIFPSPSNNPVEEH